MLHSIPPSKGLISPGQILENAPELYQKGIVKVKIVPNICKNEISIESARHLYEKRNEISWG